MVQKKWTKTRTDAETLGNSQNRGQNGAKWSQNDHATTRRDMPMTRKAFK